MSRLPGRHAAARVELHAVKDDETAAVEGIDMLHIGANDLSIELGVTGQLTHPRMRQAYALLRLCDKYGQGRVEAICQSALAFDVVSVPRITAMLKSAAKLTLPADGSRKVVQLTLPRFARPAGHFETRPSSSKKEGR